MYETYEHRERLCEKATAYINNLTFFYHLLKIPFDKKRRYKKKKKNYNTETFLVLLSTTPAPNTCANGAGGTYARSLSYLVSCSGWVAAAAAAAAAFTAPCSRARWCRAVKAAISRHEAIVDSTLLWC